MQCPLLYKLHMHTNICVLLSALPVGIVFSFFAYHGNNYYGFDKRFFLFPFFFFLRLQSKLKINCFPHRWILHDVWIIFNDITLSLTIVDWLWRWELFLWCMFLFPLTNWYHRLGFSTFGLLSLWSSSSLQLHSLFWSYVVICLFLHLKNN